MADDNLPEEGELVVATVQDVKNFGAFVSLDEYGGREGFIHIAEVASGWVKYIRDHIREGQKTVCKVIKVDPEKGHVDLSLKHVNEHQKREKIQMWKDEQRADRLLQIVLERVGLSKEDWLEKWGNVLVERYGTLYGVLEGATEEEEELFPEASKEKWLREFISIAKENIVPPKVSVEGCLILSASGKDGILKIKGALGEVKRFRNIYIAYVGAPHYRIVATGKDYKATEESIRKASDIVIKAITSNGGTGEFLKEKK